MSRDQPLLRANHNQIRNIREIFEDAELSQYQQDALLRCLAGHTNPDELTQTQATIVLSSLIAKGYPELSKWADEINHSTRGSYE